MPRITAALCLLALAGGLLAGDVFAASPKQRLEAKRAQEQAVLTQVNDLNRRFEASVEAWNGARYDLARTRAELKTERANLRLAERARKHTIELVERRVVALYESDNQPTTIGILFGSANLSEVIDRFETAKTVAAADRTLAAQATAARDHYAAVAARTARLERERSATVVRLGRERTQIGSLLSERSRLLSSVQAEVTKLQAAEARRQAILRKQAEERLAREQERLREQAAARARAAAAAERAAKAKAATAATTTTAPAATTAPPTTTAPVTTTAPEPAPAGPPPASAADPLPTTTSPAPPAPSPASGATLPAGHPEAASIAMRYLGVKYVWGGASPAGFDCSGLVMYVFAQLGISLPHYAAAQFGFGVPVPRADLQPGDLVFFDGLNHVGIYIGGGDMIHAPQTGDVVKITPLSDFGNRYVGARRI